jgi:GntR family transcriptional regulator/MocR family aminotransferase
MLLRLDGRGPRYAQITRALTAAIHDGTLTPGARLLSTRDLAADLGCARNVVLLAYEQLLLEGYLTSRAGGGTFVSPGIAVERGTGTAGAASETPRLSRSGDRIDAAARLARQILSPRTDLPIDFMYGLCEPDERTIVALRSAFAVALRARAFAYSGPAGDEGLRRALAGRLRGARGIARTADRLVMTSGAQQALDICARLLINPGDRVVVEDPCYACAVAAFEAAGANVIRLPVDRHGLDISRLPPGRGSVRIVYVTPSHQFPTGAVLPASRRYALLEFARRRGAYIIEDDYDGEFRYSGRPIEALAALDPEGPVIYCGTLAKALFPAVRLGFLSLPGELVTPVAHAKYLSDFGSSLLVQKTIARLMTSGEYDRHIRRMMRRYRARRDALIEALRSHFGDEAEVDGSGAGLHVVVWLPRLGRARVDALIGACARRQVGVYSVAPHSVALPARAGLLLGYGLVEPDLILTGIARLAEAYREVMRGRLTTRRDKPRSRPSSLGAVHG